MERKLKALILFLSFSFVSVIFFNLNPGIVGFGNDFILTETEYQEITVGKKEKIKPQELNITIDQYALPYDSKLDIYLHTVDPNQFDLSQIEIEVVADSDLDYEIGILNQDYSAESFQKNEPLELIIYTEEEYAIYTVHLTTLPIVQIKLDAPGSETKPIGEERQRGSFQLFSNAASLETKERHFVSDMYVNLRGASSRAFPKNQYRIHLREFTIGGDEKHRYESLLGLREDDDYILYSAYNDPEKARNIFAHNLWTESMGDNNRFGEMNGVEGEYVELFIDGNYWGLYGLMHPHDEKVVDLDKNHDAEESEFYYRSISNMPMDFELFEQNQGDELALNRFEMREVDEPFDDPKQWAPLYEHFKAMKQANPNELQHYLENHTDIKNQIDYYLFLIFAQATDNHYKNHNYISKLDGDTRVMLESPWDLDLTLGLRWKADAELLSYINDVPDWNFIPSETLISRAKELGVEGINEQVTERYRELRATSWSNESLNTMLDAFEEDIYHSGAIHRDKARWPRAAYHENFDGFRNYITKRLNAMDRLILEGEREAVNHR